MVDKPKTYSREDLNEATGLDTFAVNYGKDAQDSSPIKEGEAKIRSWVQAESSKIIEKYRNPLEVASGKKQKVVTELNHVEDDIKKETTDLMNKIKNEIVTRAEIKDLKDKIESAQRQVRNFLAKEKIGTPKPNTPNPDWKWILILVPFIVLGVEVFLNGQLLGSKSLNAKSAQFMVFGIALLNLGVGWIVGSILWPDTNLNVKSSKKIFTYVLISISILFVLGANAIFGHYRQAVNDVAVNEKVYKHFQSKEYPTDANYIKMKYVSKNIPYIKDGMTLQVLPSGQIVNRNSLGITIQHRIGKNIFDIGEVESLQLFALGILCFFGICIDFYNFAGSYPGYRKLLDEADGPAKDLSRHSKVTIKLRASNSQDLRKTLNKLEDRYKKNIDEYSALWNTIEDQLSSFNAEAKSLIDVARTGMREFHQDFYRHAPKDLKKVTLEVMEDLPFDKIEKNQHWDKDFIASVNHFINLKELWEYKKGVPESFINKKIRLEKFNEKIKLFTEARAGHEKELETNDDINNIVQFDLGKHREIYLVR